MLTLHPIAKHSGSGLGRPMMLAGMAVLGLGLLAGCQSSRVGALNTQPVVAPLPPAPAGTVQQGTLPAVGADQFPEAPVVASLPEETPATPDGGAAAAQPSAPSGPAINRDALVGAWKVTTGGSSCQVFMALTQWTGGYRAASRGCPGDAAKIAAWDVSGSQVVLKDSTGNTVARLYASGGSRYDGATSGGAAISLAR